VSNGVNFLEKAVDFIKNTAGIREQDIMDKVPGDLYSCLSKTAEREPEASAFVIDDHTMSWHEVLFSVDRAADMFWQQGIRKKDSVAIILRNSPEFVITYFALAKIGAISVPINHMVSKEEEILYILRNADCKGVVTEVPFIKNYLAVREKMPGLKFIFSTNECGKEGVLDFWTSLKRAHYHPQTMRCAAGENDIISILYTSGTTGNPKGVLLSHINIISNAQAAISLAKPTPDDVFMALLPLFHTLSFTSCIVAPILLGCKILIVRSITPPTAWLQAMGREGVTIMIAVPQLYSVIAREARGVKKLFLKFWSMRKVRFCVSGAAPLKINVYKDFYDAFGLKIQEGYGLTETSPILTVTPPMGIKKEGSVGVPVPGVKIKIIDENNMQLPPGNVGEICAQGPNVTCGYNNDEEASRALFTDDGWLKTGDIGEVDSDGYLFIRDRKKDMVIVKGLKVFPAQIEQIICGLEGIQECAVIGIPNKTGDETMKCFVVLKENSSLDKPAIMKYIKTHMDAYKRPREIEITDSLPKNAIQKVLKRELLKRELEKRMGMPL